MANRSSPHRAAAAMSARAAAGVRMASGEDIRASPAKKKARGALGRRTGQNGPAGAERASTTVPEPASAAFGDSSGTWSSSPHSRAIPSRVASSNTPIARRVMTRASLESTASAARQSARISADAAARSGR